MTKILIVDDNRMDQVLVTHLLSGHYQFVYASDGTEGLKACELEEPDLVVADLVMPNMDGIQMLTELKTQYPNLPVIIMTSEGCETTAATLMKLGASSFVPKRDLPERLGQTVDQVIDLMRADRDYARLLKRLTSCRYVYELENDFSLIEPLVEFIQQIAYSEGICECEGSRHRLGVALDEAMFNAMYHGNLQLPHAQIQLVQSMVRKGGPIPIVDERRKDLTYENRRVLVYITGTPKELTIVIEDQGKGFDHKRYAEQSGAKPNANHSRGILLMESIMDQVFYNDVGNRLTLIKSREASNER